MRLKPADAGYRLNLGAALRRTGDVDGALAALQGGDPPGARATPSAWADLGMVLSDKKTYDDAQAALDKATKLKPDFALAWNRLGRVELKRGQVAGGGRGAGAGAQARAEERRLRRRSLPRAVRAEGAGARRQRVPGRRRARPEEPARRITSS